MHYQVFGPAHLFAPRFEKLDAAIGAAREYLRDFPELETAKVIETRRIFPRASDRTPRFIYTVSRK